MAENFARQAIADVKTDLRALRRRKGKKTVVSLNPVTTLLKQRKQRLDKVRPLDG
jgi:hypothetical protein